MNVKKKFLCLLALSVCTMPTLWANGLDSSTSANAPVQQNSNGTITGKVTDNLTVMTGGTYMDLSIEESNNPDLKGKEPTYVASKLAKIYAEYDIAQVKGLTVTGGAYYSGKQNVDSANTDAIPSVVTFDAGTRYSTKFDGMPTIFRINVTNLTDKNYWATPNTLGNPRAIAFSATFKF